MGAMLLKCRVCDYVFFVETTMKNQLPLIPKDEDDVLGDNQWENATQTSGTPFPSHPTSLHPHPYTHIPTPHTPTTPHPHPPTLTLIHRSIRAVDCALDDCEGKEAYFMQYQIRSADEPMTSFYRCTTCSHQWREG